MSKETNEDIRNQLSEQWSEEPNKPFELYKNIDDDYKEKRKKTQYINTPRFVGKKKNNFSDY